jgi:hypothetical protein
MKRLVGACMLASSYFLREFLKIKHVHSLQFQLTWDYIHPQDRPGQAKVCSTKPQAFSLFSFEYLLLMMYIGKNSNTENIKTI